MFTDNSRRFYVGGQWIAPCNTRLIEVENPATEETVLQVAFADAQDVDRAVTAARAAFDAFSQTNKVERLALLGRIRCVYERRKGEIAEAMIAELGCPHGLAHGAQAGAGLSHLDPIVTALDQIELQERATNGDLIRHEAVGVCALITPWNWPINQIALKVLPAIAAGCTMVLKPSELTPISALIFAEVLDEAGVPPGVFNLVNGDGATTGAALVAHDQIDMVSFTGSTRAGTQIARVCTDKLKRVSLELGGKSPNVIFADAGDFDARVAGGANSCFNNTGQSCDAPTRMLVERSVYERAVTIASDVADALVVGYPTNSTTDLGPLVSGLQFERVQTLIQAGLDDGARLVSGGLGKGKNLDAGHFVRPTVFADVHTQMRIAQEEIFGPVLVMIPFDSEEDALKMANDTPFGLAAYLSSSDRDRCQRMVARMRAGNVHVNGAYTAAGSPFGGFGLSGIGREGGSEGLREFLEIKAVSGL